MYYPIPRNYKVVKMREREREREIAVDLLSAAVILFI